ncbi:hypothetical protein FQN57_001992 [Myotisia sp. PD_48]|nr:hypothetical protein FQN57_001992 [Myotisia sp. PD_48]
MSESIGNNTAFGDYISSSTFTFEVSDGRAFTVHSEPFARLSLPMQALVNGSMIEANLGRAKLDEVDPDTFIRLSEYAYYRDYTPPNHAKRSKKTSESVESNEEVPLRPIIEVSPERPIEDNRNRRGFRRPVTQLQTSLKTALANHLRESFRNLPIEQISQTWRERFIPEGNHSAIEDFTPIFMDHIRLWVLADQYQITSLCSLVIEKLHHTLREFVLYQTNVGTVIEFIRYTYSSTRPLEDGTNSLRDLVVQYAASIVSEIGDMKEFKELLAEGGDFVTDFWDTIWANMYRVVV